MVCPVCGSEELILEGSCKTCPVCGWSKCEVSFDNQLEVKVYAEGEEKDVSRTEERKN